MAKTIFYKYPFISFFTLLSSIVLFGSLSESVASQAHNSSKKKAVMPERHIALLEEYCYDCHDSVTKKGKVDLEGLSFDITKDTETAETWQHILDSMNSDEMPPPDKRQVDVSLKSDFLGDLSVQMVKARDILADTGGKITMRRLNLREYKKSIKALLGVEVNIQGLPMDVNLTSFDTIGNDLFFSSHQFEEYLSIATTALDKAIPYPDMSQIEPIKIRVDPETVGIQSMRSHYEELIGYKKKADDYCKEHDIELKDLYRYTRKKKQSDQRISLNYGKYRSKFPFISNVIHLPEDQIANGLPMRHGTIQGVSGIAHTVQVGNKDDFIRIFNKMNGKHFLKKIPHSLKFMVRVRGGYYDYAPDRRRYFQYGFGSKKYSTLIGVKKFNATVDNPEIIEFPLEYPTSIPFRMPISVGMRKYRSSATARSHDRPYIWIDYVEIEGPIFEKVPRIYKGVLERNPSESQDDYVKRVITDFATTAFRFKKPSSEYIDRLVQYHFSNNGSDKPNSFIDTFATVLTSPDFLYIKEERMNEKKTQLNSREIAVRLAYFLTSSPPSVGLLKLANQGKLTNQEALRQVVRLYLKDKKSDAFIESFLHQWLHMSRLDQFDFSPRNYPEMDLYLRKSMRKEIYETFRYILTQELPISTLLKSDFIIIDELLAQLYGIKGVSGSEFRKVNLPKGSPRGGLLGTGAFHVMGSDGTRTSPIERGAWVLRYLLNDPPPPAPANVPSITRLDKEIVSTRKKTKIHQELPQCTSCHQKIDPIGFGLQNFNAIGKWRKKEKVVKKTYRKAYIKDPNTDVRMLRRDYLEFPIDATGKLPSGKSFKNYFELRNAIFSHKDDFARGFTQHLIAYALGRPYGISDYNFVTEILQKTAKEKHTISSIIEAVVLSEQFRTK